MVAMKHKAQLMVVAAFVLLACCAGSGLWLAGQQRAADKWVRHTFEVKDQLSAARISMLRAEVYRRDYLLTGRPEAHVMLSAIRKTLPSELKALREATSDNPSQQVRVERLIALCIARLGEAGQTVSLRNQGRNA